MIKSLGLGNRNHIFRPQIMSHTICVTTISSLCKMETQWYTIYKYWSYKATPLPFSFFLLRALHSTWKIWQSHLSPPEFCFNVSKKEILLNHLCCPFIVTTYASRPPRLRQWGIFIGYFIYPICFQVQERERFKECIVVLESWGIRKSKELFCSGHGKWNSAVLKGNCRRPPACRSWQQTKGIWGFIL